jgi:predicted ester cyclase
LSSETRTRQAREAPYAPGYCLRFRKVGLEAYPELDFHLEDVLWGVNSVVLYYTNQKGTHAGEFMELSATGKVARVIAHYSA